MQTDLRDKIKESPLTLCEVARRTGINKGQLSDISRGKRNRTPEEQARLEEVLGEPIHFWNPILPWEAE